MSLESDVSCFYLFIYLFLLDVLGRTFASICRSSSSHSSCEAHVPFLSRKAGSARPQRSPYVSMSASLRRQVAASCQSKWHNFKPGHPCRLPPPASRRPSATMQWGPQVQHTSALSEATLPWHHHPSTCAKKNEGLDGQGGCVLFLVGGVHLMYHSQFSHVNYYTLNRSGPS